MDDQYIIIQNCSRSNEILIRSSGIVTASFIEIFKTKACLSKDVILIMFLKSMKVVIF